MEYFKDINISFEGANSTNPFAFRYYEPEKVIGDKKMKEHLRFAMSYWHTLTGEGIDAFGNPTMIRPYAHLEGMELAKARVDAAFEFMSKLGIEYFCFHDVDIAPDSDNLEEKNKNLDIIVDLIQKKMNETGIKLLWGTTNAFSNPRFMNGAATSPSADVFAISAALVKKSIEITHKLGGKNYVFWGGREGYETLLNTDMALENDNLARFLKMAVDYKNKIGFKGQFLIEPKPKEPTKHQYDYDSSTVMAFLRKYGLEKDFKLNIEGNHAILAGHSFAHELMVCRINNMLGSIDANKGDSLLGWDTDQFPTNIYDTTLAMYEVLKNGGIAPGGLNFDAKVRRASNTVEDLFIAFRAGMDTFARGLIIADKLLKDRALEDFIENRYKSYKSGIGKKIIEGSTDFDELSKYAFSDLELKVESGRQEMLEDILNRYILNS